MRWQDHVAIADFQNPGFYKLLLMCKPVCLLSISGPQKQQNSMIYKLT